MFLRCCFFALSLVASGFAAPSSARAQDDDEMPLRFKAFDPGNKAFYQLVESTTALKLQQGEREKVVHRTSCIFIIRWTPQPAEGKYLVVKRRLVGRAVCWGTSGRQDTPLLDDFKLEVTLVFDAESMRVKEVRGRELAVSRVPECGEFFGDEQLKDAASQPWFGALCTSVKKDTSWRDAFVSNSRWQLPWGAMDGSIEGVREFKYLGLDNGLSRISVVPKLSYRRPMIAPKGAVRLIKGSLETREGRSHGTIVFDPAKGRAVEASYLSIMQGACTFEVDGAELPMDVELAQKLDFTTSDAMPELPTKPRT